MCKRDNYKLSLPKNQRLIADYIYHLVINQYRTYITNIVISKHFTKYNLVSNIQDIIRLDDFIDRIVMYLCNDEDKALNILLYAFILYEKLLDTMRRQGYFIDYTSIYKMYASVIYLSYIFLDDHHKNAEHHAELFGISIKELDRISMMSFQLLNYRLLISNEEFKNVKPDTLLK